MEGNALVQPILAGFGNGKVAAFKGVVEVYVGSLPADDGNAAGFLRLVFVDGLLGNGVDAGVEVGNLDHAVCVGRSCGVDALAGNCEADTAHLAVLGGFDELHTAGHDLKAHISRHGIVYGRAVGGEVLRTAACHAIAPYHNAPARCIGLFGGNGHSAGGRGIAGNGKLIAVDRKLNTADIAGEPEISQHAVGIGKGNGVVRAVPFQFVGACGGGAAVEKAGQHGVLLYRAFDLIVVAENLTAQRMVVTDHLNDIVVALRAAPHMVKLAVALAYDCLPYEQLRGDLRGKLVFVRSPGVAVALPAILHDSTDICLDDSRRNGRIQARRVAVPKALAVGAV